MKKIIKVTALLITIVLVSGAIYAEAASGTKSPFDAIWNAINDLTNKVANIQLVQGPQGEPGQVGPMGPQGEPGPQGPQGLPASQGAGNVAFSFHREESVLAVLTFDGVVYARSLNGQVPSEWIEMSATNWIPGINPPMPVSEIIQWQLFNVFDKNGDTWVFQENTWLNLGQP